MPEPKRENLSKKQLRKRKPIRGITNKIRRFLWQFPCSSAKEVCRVLGLDYFVYRNFVYVEKCHLKKWLGTKIQGRLPSPLVSAHRVEWEIEKSIPQPLLLKLSVEAEKRRPNVRSVKPVGEWYVIPNRNNMREFHDMHVTVRVFPKSGTCRVLPGHPMSLEDLGVYVENAFFKGGLDIAECERLSRQLIPSTKHRTFRVGPVTPFKIDYYRDSLGITIKADGSHPEHIEVGEDWPSWIKPQLRAIAMQTEAVTQLAEQIRLHLAVMEGIQKSTDNLAEATEKLRETMEKRGSKV